MKRQRTKKARLFVLLAAQSGIGVGNLDSQLSCPLHDELPVLGGHIVGDLSTVGPTQRRQCIRHQLMGAKQSTRWLSIPHHKNASDELTFSEFLVQGDECINAVAINFNDTTNRY